MKMKPRIHELILEEYVDLVVKNRKSREEALNAIQERHPNLQKQTIERYVRDDKRRMGESVVTNNEEVKKQIVRNSEQFYKTQYLNLLKRAANEDQFLDSLRSAVIPVSMIKLPEISIGTGKELLPTLMLSDAHANRVVSRDEMEGYGEYNFEICLARMWACLEETIASVRLFRNQYTIPTIDIDILGDMLNDEHRDENKWTNLWPNSEATVIFSGVLAQFILILLQEFETVRVNCVVGNESRIPIKMPAKLQYHNYDYLLYEMTKAYLKEYVKRGKVFFNIPKSPEVVVEKLGWKTLLMHGHSVRSWAGLPVYGLTRMEAQQQSIRKDKGGVDLIECAHFHEANDIKNERIFINGSITGLDEFAKNMLHCGGNSSQTLHYISQDYFVEYKRIIKNMEDVREHPFVYGDNSDPAIAVLE